MLSLLFIAYRFLAIEFGDGSAHWCQLKLSARQARLWARESARE
ncbi:hypothetical protein [Microcoleus sp.]